MPSENKTANIGLNQWQANEYPKREDFNADNLAIDEALDGKLSKTGDGKDVTVSFNEAATRSNIGTGESLKIMFGKISKFFHDLKTVAFTGSYVNLDDKPNDENLDVCENTKTALGLTQPEPKIKDAIAQLSSAVNPLQYVWEKYKDTLIVGRSTCTYSDEIISPSKTIARRYSDTIEYSATAPNHVKLSGKITTIQVSYDNCDSFDILGKYVETDTEYDTSPICKATSNFRKSTRMPSSGPRVYQTGFDCDLIEFRSTYVDTVVSFNQNAFSDNEKIDGHRYSYKGKPQYIGSSIATGWYMGTGMYGSSNKNSLMFGFVPKLLFILRSSGIEFQKSLLGAPFINPCTYAVIEEFSSQSMYTINVEWTGKKVSWYTGNADSQFNESEIEYYYVAIG